MILLALGYTVTKSQLPGKQLWYIIWFIFTIVLLQFALFLYQNEVFDPGVVLYIYESPPGFCLIILKVIAWFVFTISCYKTSKKVSSKMEFYASLFSLGSIWFLFHPLTVSLDLFSYLKTFFFYLQV